MRAGSKGKDKSKAKSKARGSETPAPPHISAPRLRRWAERPGPALDASAGPKRPAWRWTGASVEFGHTLIAAGGARSHEIPCCPLRNTLLSRPRGRARQGGAAWTAKPARRTAQLRAAKRRGGAGDTTPALLTLPLILLCLCNAPAFQFATRPPRHFIESGK